MLTEEKSEKINLDCIKEPRGFDWISFTLQTMPTCVIEINDLGLLKTCNFLITA